jgi:hypothetical protein
MFRAHPTIPPSEIEPEIAAFNVSVVEVMMEHIGDKAKDPAAGHVAREKLKAAMANGIAQNHMSQKDEDNPAIGGHKGYP